MSLFSDMSNGTSPVFDSSFDSGKSAVMKLEADQKQNRREFGSLPVTPVNISLNRFVLWNLPIALPFTFFIFDFVVFSENNDEREKQFADFIRAKCYSPEEISNVLRNKLNLDARESALV